jgi:hypothetical protein
MDVSEVCISAATAGHTVVIVSWKAVVCAAGWSRCIAGQRRTPWCIHAVTGAFVEKLDVEGE